MLSLNSFYISKGVLYSIRIGPALLIQRGGMFHRNVETVDRVCKNGIKCINVF